MQSWETKYFNIFLKTDEKALTNAISWRKSQPAYHSGSEPGPFHFNVANFNLLLSTSADLT